MKRILQAALDLRERSWKVRGGILAVATFALLGVLALSSGSTSPTAASEPAPTAPATTSTSTTAVVPTTVDPKAIQAGVAAFLSHEGPTPQELAAVPPTSHTTHHGTGGAGHTHK